MKKLLLFFFAAFATLAINAQEMSLEELKAAKAEKEAAVAALNGEIAGLQGKIDTYPGWKFGGLGVLGFNMFGNNSWYSIPQPYSRQNSIGLGFTAFANHDAEKTFWRNSLILNMSETNSKENADAANVETISDKLSIASLAGYKLTDKIALSAEASYVSSLLNFNDPGQLTISAGVTWLPITDLVVVIHPIGYQINFPSADFSSVPGAKIGATYTKEILAGVKWNSTLSAFLSYGEGDNNFVSPVGKYSAGDMSNWTWENGFAFTAWKGIGVGFNIGLAGNKQLVDKYRFELPAGQVDQSTEENPLQSYYNLGLSYEF